MTPAIIDMSLRVADEEDLQLAIHTDTLNEAGFVEDRRSRVRPLPGARLCGVARCATDGPALRRTLSVERCNHRLGVLRVSRVSEM